MPYIKNTTRRIQWSHDDYEGPPATQIGPSRLFGHVAMTEVKSGTAVPKFRALIKAGSPATSLYSRTDILNEIVGELTPFGALSVTVLKDPPKNTKLTETTYGTLINSVPPTISQDFSATANLALTKFYKRLAEQQTQAHAMQFLGELRETIALFRHPFRAAKQLVDRYFKDVVGHSKKYKPRQSFQGRKRFEKAVADSWLEVAFGIRPLISDVKDLAKAALRAAYDDNIYRQRITGTHETPVFGSEASTIFSTNTVFIGLRMNELVLGMHSVRFIGELTWVRGAAPASSFERLIELFGFRADLFVPTLYELAPWSFLLDYFSNLGTVIETSCQSTANVAYVMRCDRAKSFLTAQTVGFHNNKSFNVDTFQSNPGRHELVRTSFYRTPLGRLYSVPFQFSIPSSPTKYLNMLALWRSKSVEISRG